MREPKIELLNMDCMDYMRECEDNQFNLSIVDPPYGLGIDGQKENKKGKKSDRREHLRKGWDKAIPEAEYFRELKRISKNQIIWGGNYFVKHLDEGHKGWVVWDKAQHGLTMSDCELAYSSFDCPTRIFTQNRVILLQEGTTHPTQKPIKLYEWLLKNYAKENDKIFDSHLGSGSSAIACDKMGFDFVGIEIDKEYFDAASKRLKEHQDQFKLAL